MDSCELAGSGAKGTGAMLLGALCSKSRRARDAAAMAGDINGSAAGDCDIDAEVIVLRPAGTPSGEGGAGGLAD